MKKILLVDADVKLLDKLGKRLGKAGYEVTTASDGSGALESALTKKPDLVITNYHLPLFDGERLRSFLRSNPTTTHIPFIYLIDAERGHDETLASIGGDVYLVKPFRWQDMQDKISLVSDPAKGVPAVVSPGAGVEGSLSEVSLVDLLQIFGLNRRTGTLNLHNNGDTGVIHLLDGVVISTVLGETTGEKALYRILRWHKGSFRYQPGPVAVTRNITRSMDALLMEGMRQLDEWESIYQLMPPPETVLKISKKRDELPTSMRPVTQEVLLLLEFYDTVGEVIEKANHTDYDVCKSILGLIQKGIIQPIADTRSAVRKEGPLVSGDRVVRIHRALTPGKGDQSGIHWGRVLVFASDPDMVKNFLSWLTDVHGFRLSRENFSNQEIINSSFGALGVIDISENAYMQLFLLPSFAEASPLWRAFGEGTVGAFHLGMNGDAKGGTSAQSVSVFMERELERPLVFVDMDPSRRSRDTGPKLFHELFENLLERQMDSEETRT
ncbi:MAG: DUF4388 domain-containing protein [bacterium]|nr:MAG: DUF4388 domain-containing protein [bacterium]